MNTKIEMNSALTDTALDGVVGGSFWGTIGSIMRAGGGPVGVNVIAFATPWGQVSHAASTAAHAAASVVSHFKFW